jgi:hypothetical protein
VKESNRYYAFAAFHVLIAMALALTAACGDGGGEGETDADADAPSDVDAEGEADAVPDADAVETVDMPPDVPADAPTTTVTPAEIDDVLTNPGMGFADFHHGAGGLSPDEYPTQTVAYFRWTWDQLEPSDGSYDFDRVDGARRWPSGS